MFFASTVLVAAAFISSVAAHARLGTMIPGYGRLLNVDGFENRSPVNAETLPANLRVICKGYHKRGGSVARKSLKPGPNEFDIDTEMAPHNGGSMQVSLSFDEGATFKVIKSFIGGFPRNGGGNTVDPNQKYNFEIPADTQSGPAIFSWSWSNEVGNREWYQDCAPITIDGSGTNKLADFPDIFIGNAETLTSCKNAEGVSVEYPNPGKSVERGPNAKTGPPTGDCGKAIAAAPGASTATADPPMPATGGGGGGSYTVMAGDTCDAIAKSKGTTLEALRKNNPTINEGCTNIMPGQMLVLRKRSRVMRFE